jgi:regulator of protease activity HflC (stomatin/prohibitin superfamily)
MSESEDKGVAMTLGVLALTGVVLVAVQIKSLSFERGILEKQLVALAERVTASKLARKQVDEAFEQREQQIKRASATEAQYAGLLTDLLELSKTDPEARLVTQKWKIQASGEAQKAATEAVANQVPPPSESRSVKPGPAVPVAKPKAAQ